MPNWPSIPGKGGQDHNCTGVPSYQITIVLYDEVLIPLASPSEGLSISKLLMGVYGFKGLRITRSTPYDQQEVSSLGISAVQ